MSSTTTSYGVSREAVERGLTVAHALGLVARAAPSSRTISSRRFLSSSATSTRIVAAQPAAPRGRHSPLPTCDLHLDAPAVIGHDALRDGQPEAGALARRLGGEERVEDPRQRSPSGIPGPSSCELDLDLVAARARADGQAPAALHRLERVRGRARGTPGGAGPRSAVTSGSVGVELGHDRGSSAKRDWCESSSTVFSDQRVDVGRRSAGCPARARTAAGCR